MFHLNKLRFQNKLIVLLIFPLLGMLFFSLAWIVVQFKRLSESKSIVALTDLSIEIGNLVHETQKERGLTAGYLTEKKSDFTDIINDQKALTDKQIRHLNEHLEMFDSEIYGDNFNQDLQNAIKGLATLSQIRGNVASRNITTDEAIEYYTNLNSTLMSLIEYLSNYSNDAELATMSAAYMSFLQGKERAGLERAILNNTFARDNFAEGMLVRFNSLVASQESYMNVFMSLASADQKILYIKKINAPPFKEVQRIREIALQKAMVGGFGISAPQWFEVMTQKIEILKEIENSITSDIHSKANQMLKTSRNALLIDFGVTIFVLLAVTLLSYIITKDILRHLGGEPMAIVELSRKISHGNLNIHMDIVADKNSLFYEMKNMSENLRSDILKVIEAANDVQGCSEDIKSRMNTLTLASKDQVTAADQVAGATTELSQTVLDVALNASNIADSATDTMNVAHEGAKIVEDNVSEAIEISRTVTESSQLMTSLGERSNQIGEIIKVINEIADQTNLLALNAAIEAARAGEQGRGFAVVADEVRRLAERTSNSTSEISEMITSIQDETQKAISSMQESLVKVDKGTSLSRAAGEALQKIVERVNNLQTKVQQIAAATEEMSTTTEVITEDISSIAKSSHETSKSASDTTEQTNYLAQLSEKLKEVTNHFIIN